MQRRTPQGCVDRNLRLLEVNSELIAVAPRRGAWIEILLLRTISIPGLVAPRRGAWIEILTIVITSRTTISRTPQGCVDRN